MSTHPGGPRRRLTLWTVGDGGDGEMRTVLRRLDDICLIHHCQSPTLDALAQDASRASQIPRSGKGRHTKR